MRSSTRRQHASANRQNVGLPARSARKLSIRPGSADSRHSSSFMGFSAIEVVKLVEILMMRDGGDGTAPGRPGNNADAAVWQRSDGACKRAPGRQSRCGDRERGVEEANLPLQGDVRRLERERARAGVIS